ncbi:MAG: nitrilase-related carbon-nitrogen hydrolase [Bryobacterales bacterium]
MNSDHIRVASLQYFIRPVRSFDQFREQVEALVDTAEDYRCKLIVFPEYFSAQLLTLGDIRRPMQEQIRDLASQAPRVCELMQQLAKDYKIHIVAGTVPTMDKGDDERVYNESFFSRPTATSACKARCT